MRNSGLYLISVVGFGLLAVVLSVSDFGYSAAEPKPQPVQVVNTVSQPVPTTVQGTPTMNLGIGNTVGISGPVNVGNDATSPLPVRDVDNPARFAFHSNRSNTMSAGEDELLLDFFPVVPAGKRLVIEYVSVRASLPVGQRIVSASVVGNFFPVTFQGSNGISDTSVGGQLVRAYADAGGTPTVFLIRSSSIGTGVAIASISGYLIDVD